MVMSGSAKTYAQSATIIVRKHLSSRMQLTELRFMIARIVARDRYTEGKSSYMKLIHFETRVRSVIIGVWKHARPQPLPTFRAIMSPANDVCSLPQSSHLHGKRHSVRLIHIYLRDIVGNVLFLIPQPWYW